MQEQACEHGSKDKSKQANKQRALIYVNFKVQFTGGRQFLEELKVQIYDGNEVLLTRTNSEEKVRKILSTSEVDRNQNHLKTTYQQSIKFK